MELKFDLHNFLFLTIKFFAMVTRFINIISLVITGLHKLHMYTDCFGVGMLKEFVTYKIRLP